MRGVQLDGTACVALLVIGAVSSLAILSGGNPGQTVAAAGVGAIGGWLSRGALKPAAGPGEASRDA